MKKFAIYYIPNQESDLYKTGSQYLGYDIFNKKDITPDDNLLKQLDDNPTLYNHNAKEYGFHLTITDAIEFDSSNTTKIINECQELLDCFAPETTFNLIRSDKFLTTSPAHDNKIILLGFEASDTLKILHTLLVSRLHPMGTGSLYTKWLKTKIEYFNNEKNKIMKSKKFFTPTAFDQYFPHFTLMNPYTGTKRDQIISETDSIFDNLVPQTVQIDSLYLVVKDGDLFEIVHEFVI